MDKESIETCGFSWDGEEPLSKEIEIASIFSDVVLKKHSDKKLLFLKDKPEKISFISKLYFPLRLLHPEYLFSWDETPVKNNFRLTEYLGQKFGIDWAKTATVEKINYGKTIKVFKNKNYLFLKLNDEKTSVNLEIDDGRTDKFIAKIENGKINIYGQGDLSFVLGTSFFKRNIRDYKLDKNKIENSIDELKDGITIEKLMRFNELLGSKGIFDKMMGKEKENYIEFQINGGYPNKYPNRFSDEFKFIKNIFILQKDGVILQQGIPDHSLENSAKKLRTKLDEIESDVKYINEKKAIISDIVNALNKQKDEIDKQYLKLHAEVLENCNEQDMDVSLNTAETVSVIDREFESNINMFAKYYPLLQQGLVNPTEFGEWAGIASDVYPHQKHDRKYQAIAANLLGKIRTCKSIISRLKPEDGQPPSQIASFINQVDEMSDAAEKQLYRQLNYTNNTIKEIWAKEEAVEKNWNYEIKQLEDRIEGLLKEQKEILKRLDLILTSKISIVEEIKANIAIPVNSTSDNIYLPFWVACLSRQNEHRLLVYGPMKKKYNKGRVDALKDYTMPLEPYSGGVERLRTEIETRLRQDRKLAEEVIIEGIKFNKLNAQGIELINKGLEILKNEGWIKDKQIKSIYNGIARI